MASNIAITGKKKNKSHISYIPETFWGEFTDFIDKPLVQCHTPAVKILHYIMVIMMIAILISILNGLFLKLILCTV